MAKISVCIDAVFAGKDFVQSLKDIRSAGVDTFEFWSWENKDIPAIKAAKDELGLSVATFCTKGGSLIDASNREPYINGLRESIEIAKLLGCRSLIATTGNDNGYPREVQRRAMVVTLQACAPLLEEAGVTLLLEPLNLHVDHPGYFLSSSLEGFSIIDEVASPNVKLLFDIYHQQITEGNLITNITANIAKIGHFHAAGHPGRHELHRGEINYPEVFKAIDAAGYQGCIGLEYFPLEDPIEGIKASL